MNKGLYPFFCYYGGKWRVAPKYPKPIFGTIIEPFAGGAGYSLRNFSLDIHLYEIDPIIHGIWDYLIKVSSEEIAALPIKVDHVDEISVVQEAKWLIGFWLNKATTQPSKVPSSWAKSGVRPNSHWGEVIRNRIASQVGSIKHWKLFNRSYDSAADVEATWFIDPPYQGKCGRFYKYNIIDYSKLGSWCSNRRGQVIVCEQSGANWLPFVPFGKIKAMGGSGNSHSDEVVWLNDKQSVMSILEL